MSNNETVLHTNPESLPRVTYFNTSLDMAGIHAHLDAAMPHFMETQLGKTRPNFIGGVQHFEGTPYKVPSPIDHNIMLAELVSASDNAISTAVKAAKTAQPAWEAAGFEQRIKMLRGVAEAMRGARFELAMGAVLEVGKSRAEALGETEEAIDLILYYCDEAERNNFWQQKMKTVSTETGLDVLRPFGVFAVISPFNFPLALSTSMISAALIMGNSVIFKPTANAAFSGPMLAQLFGSMLPEGVFNFIAGDRDVGQKLTEAQIDGVAFTGSHAVGTKLLQQFAATPPMRPVIAELGGKNVTFIGQSADLDMAASAVARAAFGLSGQKCSACAKVYVAEKLHDDFAALLVKATAEIVATGNPLDKATFMGPVINEVTGTRFDDACTAARKDGKILFGGERLTGGVFDRGAYVQPTIVGHLPYTHDLNRRELFMPFVSVLPYEDFGTALQDANSGIYGLTAGLYTTDKAECDLWLNNIETGVLYVNRPSASTTGAWPGYQGFVGWKGSGLSGKGGLGPHYVAQFGREQSRTIYW